MKSKNTTPEMVVWRMVHDMGYRYRLHVKGLAGTPDLVFPSRRKVINVHGCFWHMHSCGRCRIPASRHSYWLAKIRHNAARDKRTLAAQRRAGWKVLVVWECQTLPARVQRLRAKIDAFLGEKSRLRNKLGRHPSRGSK